jgi:hypothetical protein
MMFIFVVIYSGGNMNQGGFGGNQGGGFGDNMGFMDDNMVYFIPAFLFLFDYNLLCLRD